MPPSRKAKKARDKQQDPLRCYQTTSVIKNREPRIGTSEGDEAAGRPGRPATGGSAAVSAELSVEALGTVRLRLLTSAATLGAAAAVAPEAGTASPRAGSAEAQRPAVVLPSASGEAEHGAAPAPSNAQPPPPPLAAGVEDDMFAMDEEMASVDALRSAVRQGAEAVDDRPASGLDSGTHGAPWSQPAGLPRSRGVGGGARTAATEPVLIGGDAGTAAAEPVPIARLSSLPTRLTDAPSLHSSLPTTLGQGRPQLRFSSPDEVGVGFSPGDASPITDDEHLPPVLRIAARRERDLATPHQVSTSAPADLAAWPTVAASVSSAGEKDSAAMPAMGAEDGSDAESEEEGVLCAICHSNIQPKEAALVQGCDHPFCCSCILNWALQKPKCPLCQTGFTHLWLYRQLDGTYNDYLVEENIDLLHQTVWFKKKARAQRPPPARPPPARPPPARPPPARPPPARPPPARHRPLATRPPRRIAHRRTCTRGRGTRHAHDTYAPACPFQRTTWDAVLGASGDVRVHSEAPRA